MFRAKPWAEAFIRVAGGGAVAEEALEYLRVFCRAALLLPGDLSGRNDAYRLDRAIRAALAREAAAREAAEQAPGVNAAGGANSAGGGANSASCDAGTDSVLTLAERFVQLMIRKACFKRYKEIIREIEKIINKQKGIEEVIVEAAAEQEETFLAVVKEKARRLTGAREVKLTQRLIPGLIGGIRLRWGSRVFDGSIAYRLKKMAGVIGK